MTEIIFGDGTAVVDLPEGWKVSENGFFESTVTIPECPSAVLYINLNSYEHPESVRCGNVGGFVFEEGMPFTDDSGVAPETLFAFGYLAGDSQAYVQVFKWAQILPPDHIRVLVARLNLHSIADARKLQDTVMRQIRKMLETARFCDRLTPLDRIAPAESLKVVEIENTVFLRVPREWHHDLTEAGRYYCDTRDEADGTLWIDWDVYQDKSDTEKISAREKASQFAEIIQEAGHRQVVVEGDDIRAILWSVNRGNDDLTTFSAKLFVAERKQLVVAHFSLVLSEPDTDTPAALQCRAIVEREVRNALALPSAV